MNASEQAEACPTKTTLPNSDHAALIARAAAAQHSLDPALICAIVEQESAWDPHAIRYEPAFRTRYVAPLGLPPTEEVARSISWGLMQVMGQVAREHGFTAKSLAALCDPATGLAIGCAVFAAKLRASTNDAASAVNNSDAASVAGDVVEHALELWNGGANTSYAAQVLARVAHYR
jgi:soluble lytic murein transglycosylase-like protein